MVEFEVKPGIVKETIIKTTSYAPINAPEIREKTVTKDKKYTARMTQEESVKVYGKGKIKIRKGNEFFGQLRLAMAVLQGKFKTYGGLPDEPVDEARAVIGEYKGVKTSYDTVLKDGGKAETVAETEKKVDSEGLETKVEETKVEETKVEETRVKEIKVEE